MRLILFILATCMLSQTSCQSTKETPPVDAINKTVGVWIAAPHHNELLKSHGSLVSGINQLHNLGVNTIFLCTWAKNQTAFESQVLLENSNYTDLSKTSFFYPVDYQSETNDPVADLIEEAHKQKMKVIFWFEFGFMAQWGADPDSTNHPILAVRPKWKGIGNDGKGTNYNETDYYFNSYHPEVQQFMLDLVAESLDKYPEVDGIQGDDRLPASPANSGYDAWTQGAYQKVSGQLPPVDFRDKEWFDWRIDLLNEFAGRLHQLVKSRSKDYVMAFSPNPYPWALENLMQDWPTWIKNEQVDMLNVQCYRSDFNSYKKVVDENWSYAKEGITKDRFVPGIILGIASKKIMSTEVLDSILKYQESQQFGGQSYFYVKWLTEDSTFHPVFDKYH